MKKSFFLVILDGFGIGPEAPSNAIFMAKPKILNFIKSHYPAGTVQASSIAVGMPWNEEGNSEVGHLTIGAGRVIYQHYPRISISIRNGEFFNNPTLKAAAEHVRKNKSALNFVGLLTTGTVHAAFEHLEALLQFAEKEKIDRVNLHLFSDGKDGTPKSVLQFIKKVPMEKIASLGGRFYAMDRDGHWERTERAYKAITGQGELLSNAEDALKAYFEKDKYGEDLIEPMVVGEKNNGIKDNDAVIFFNFREDSMRQLVTSFIDKSFKKFKTLPLKNVYFASMTKYSDKFGIPIISSSEIVENPLGKAISDAGKSQLRIAETEKYAHVTYFINGYREIPFENEYRILVHSKNVLSHADHPEMMAKEITAKAIGAMEEGIYDIIIINYANADMIAHTGNFEAGVKAIQALDVALGNLVRAALENGSTLLITADHGNAEQMVDPQTGTPESKHNESPVPVYVVSKHLERVKSESDIIQCERTTIGILSDIAPTVLELMDIKKPANMTGQSLLPYLI
ncbi:MAG: 2,3-bisphosphoglycerate-independent phosphoglycerate mutase [bacterium]|nr:2,3-bisphosphoglycerate-independent phosphoglycerate mutase [bacterium]